MRRRIGLLSTLVALLLIFILPASTAAASGFSFAVKSNYCSGSDVHFKVRNIAAGWTDANKLTIESWAQAKPLGYGRWHNIYHWDIYKYTFYIDGTRHWSQSNRVWYGDSYNWYRIKMRLRAWHNGYILAQKNVYSVKC